MGNTQPKYGRVSTIDEYVNHISEDMEYEQFASVREPCLRLLRLIEGERKDLCAIHEHDLVIDVWTPVIKKQPKTFGIFTKNKQYTCECATRISKIGNYIDQIYLYMDPLLPRAL